MKELKTNSLRLSPRVSKSVMICAAWVLGGPIAGLLVASLLSWLMLFMSRSEALGQGMLILGLLGLGLVMGLIVGVMKAEDSWKMHRRQSA